MSLGSQTFDAVYGIQEDLRGSVRYAGETIAKAICAGVDIPMGESEEGFYPAADAAVRYKLSDQPEAWNTYEINGKMIELKRGSGSWFSYRVTAYTETAGLVRLTLANEQAER